MKRSELKVKAKPIERLPTVKTRRRRPGDQQREQKEATRQRLLNAARAVFEVYSYTKTSVDIIADEAGVSRTTFYRHFDGKLAVAIALFSGSMAHRVQVLWRDLLEVSNPSLSDVESWLTQDLEIVEGDRVLVSVLREVDATEPDVQPQVLRYHEEVIRLMWGNRWDDQPGRLAALWARSLLLLLQIDQFLYAMYIRKWDIDHQSLKHAMAGLLHEFLQFRRRELSSRRNQLTKGVPA